MSIDQDTYGSTLVEPKWLSRDPLAGSGRALRGVAVRDHAGPGALPAVVRHPGVVESVTAHVITVRCGDGFAEAYVLVADVSGGDGEPGGVDQFGQPPTFDSLRPGDEVMVTSWVDPDELAS